MTITILDENGEVAEAEMQTLGGHEVAVVNGHFLMPGAYTILSPEGRARIRQAEDRAEGRRMPWDIK